jgi:glycosyltransferase involved in cell wall biosynthesis
VTLEIMMPFFGRPDHFRIAVESVLAQTSPDWRLTVVDDVYPDVEPGKWVAGLRDKRITYIRNKTNLGPSLNFNKCLELSAQEYVTFIGCDDVFLPNYVGEISRMATSFPQASILQPGVRTIDQNGQSSRGPAEVVKSFLRPLKNGEGLLSGEKLAQSLLRGNWAYFPSLAWRTQDLRDLGFRSEFNVVQDLMLILDLVESGRNLAISSETAFLYRRHKGSYSAMTGSDGSKFREESKLYAEMSRRMSNKEWYQAARTARLHLISRLEALSLLPPAIISGDRQGWADMLRHIFGRPFRDLS